MLVLKEQVKSDKEHQNADDKSLIFTKRTQKPGLSSDEPLSKKLNYSEVVSPPIEFFSFGGSSSPLNNVSRDLYDGLHDVRVNSADGMKAVKAHKLILAGHSRKFHDIFQSQPDSKEIDSDLRGDLLGYLMEIIYNHSVKVPKNAVQDFVAAVREFGLYRVQTVKYRKIGRDRDESNVNPGEISFGLKVMENIYDMGIDEILADCYEGPEGFYYCGVCLKAIKRKDHLKTHVQEVHLENHLEFGCKNCSFVSKTRSGVRNHLRTKHPECSTTHYEQHISIRPRK